MPDVKLVIVKRGIKGIRKSFDAFTKVFWITRGCPPCAPVAQLDRAVDSGSAGCVFESHRARFRFRRNDDIRDSKIDYRDEKGRKRSSN